LAAARSTPLRPLQTMQKDELTRRSSRPGNFGLLHSCIPASRTHASRLRFCFLGNHRHSLLVLSLARSPASSFYTAVDCIDFQPHNAFSLSRALFLVAPRPATPPRFDNRRPPRPPTRTYFPTLNNIDSPFFVHPWNSPWDPVHRVQTPVPFGVSHRPALPFPTPVTVEEFQLAAIMRTTQSLGQLAVLILSLSPAVSAWRAWPRFLPEIDALVVRQDGMNV